MKNNVVKLSDFKIDRDNQDETDNAVESGNPFEAQAATFAERKAKAAAERKSQNESVLRSYRLKA